MAGSRSLGTLTVDLVAKIAGFVQGMDKAERDLDKRAKRMNAIAKKIGVGIGTAISAGVAASAALATGLKISIDRMDELSKAAQRASLPTEQFTQLAYAGDLADVSMEELTKSLGKLAKAQGDAQAGLKTQKQAFEQLGIAYSNANGSLRSTHEVFLDFADAFQKYKGSPEVVAAGMQIFGRSFQTLIPLLKDGRAGLEAAADEADRLGITLSTQAGQNAEAFNDNLTRLNTAMKGLWQSLASELLPDLVKLTDQFVGAASSGDKLKETAQDIADILRALGTVTGVVVDGFKVVSGVVRGVMFDMIALGNASQAAWDAMNGDFKGAEANLRDAKLAREMAAKASDDIEAVFKGTTIQGPTVEIVWAGEGPDPSGLFKNQAKGLTPPPIPLPIKAGGGRSKQLSDEEKEAKRLLETYQRLTATYDERIALFGKEGEAAKVRYDIEFGELSKLTDAQKADLLSRAERLDQMKLEAELSDAADNAVRRRTQAYQEQQAAVKDQIADMEFQLQLYSMSNVEQEKAIALRYANVDAMSEEGQKIGDLVEQMDKAAKANQVWDEVQRSLSDSMFDAITGASSLKDAFLDLVDNIERAILRSITDGWAEQITGWFKGVASSSGGSSGGGSDWGAIIGSLLSGGKASGGGVRAGSIQPISEYRPEVVSVGSTDYLVMGSQSGQVHPKPALGGSSLQQNIYVTGTVSKQSAMQLQQEAAMRQRIATARS